MEVIRIPISDILADDRLRPMDSDWAQSIAATVLDRQGPGGDIDTPILVSQPRRDGKRWLLAGGRRLEACRILNKSDVPAIERRTLVGQNREAVNARRLIEIDENLIREELNPLDKAVFLAERQKIYEEQHPETTKGGDRGNQHTGGKNRQTDILSFCQDAAEKTGLNERTISRSVNIARNIPEKHRDLIAGTPFAAKQSNLLALAKHGPDKQKKIIKLIFAKKDPAPSVAVAVKVIDGHVERVKSPDEKLLEKLEESWGRTNAKVRRQFLEVLIKDGTISRKQVADNAIPMAAE